MSFPFLLPRLWLVRGIPRGEPLSWQFLGFVSLPLLFSVLEAQIRLRVSATKWRGGKIQDVEGGQHPDWSGRHRAWDEDKTRRRSAKEFRRGGTGPKWQRGRGEEEEFKDLDGGRTPDGRGGGGWISREGKGETNPTSHFFPWKKRIKTCRFRLAATLSSSLASAMEKSSTRCLPNHSVCPVPRRGNLHLEQVRKSSFWGQKTLFIRFTLPGSEFAKSFQDPRDNRPPFLSVPN